MEKRTSSWGVLLKRSGIGLAPADIVGRILDLGLGGRGGTGSTFIFPIDIFLRNPQRLFFSFEGLDRCEPLPSLISRIGKFGTESG